MPPALPAATPFEWKLSDQQQAQLRAKACLLQALHGMQQQSKPLIHTNGPRSESDWASDEGRVIVQSGFEGLQQRFLDRFAEILSRQKSASFVSATAMRPFEDRVVLYYARNATSETKDARFLRQFVNCMEAISSQGNISYVVHFRPNVRLARLAGRAKDDLFRMMSAFYWDRLEHHTTMLQKYMIANVSKLSTAEDKIRSLFALLNPSMGPLTHSRVMDITNMAYCQAASGDPWGLIGPTTNGPLPKEEMSTPGAILHSTPRAIPR